jgi:RNA polymerase sigma factor (TIGR02999 family)
MRQNPSMSTPSEPAPHDAALAQSAATLAPLFYADLRRLARRVRRGVRDADTLQTTALIHEAYLKLHATPAWKDRQHFLRAAALAMRQVLVDDARARHAQRRDPGEPLLPLEAAETVAADDDDARLLAVDEALAQLAAFSPRLAQVVECRYFAGYTSPETAEALGLSLATVERDWVKARSWLFQHLRDSR